MVSAVTQVFETYELLQMILAALPPRRLFVAQAVCTTWASIVSTSPKILKLLFLMPTNDILAPHNVEAHEAQGGRTVAEYSKELSFNRIIPSMVVCQHWDKVTVHPCMVGHIFFFGEHFRKCHEHAIELEPAHFFTSPPCKTAQMIVSISSAQETQREGEPRDNLHCSLRDPDGLKTHLLMETARTMLNGVESLQDDDIISVSLWYCMPVSKETKDLWKAEANALKPQTEEGGEVREIDVETPQVQEANQH